MKIHIASAFDKNFISRALTAYKSLAPHLKEAEFWFLCLDKETKPIVNKLDLPGVHCVDVEEMNNQALIKTRRDRDAREFAMTSKSNFLSHLINSGRVKNGEMLVLTDVDMIFYPPIKELFDKEIKDADHSIFLTPHNFPPKKEWLIKEVGFYNLGFITFKINEHSSACIHKWANQCVEWCYLWHDYENNRYTDQLYGQNWENEYPGVLSLQNKGVNMGTWSIDKYKITEKYSQFYADEEPISCYHFHGLKLYVNKMGKIKPYPICVYNKNLYQDYINKLQESHDHLKSIYKDWSYGISPHPGILRIAKQKIWKIIKK